MKISFSEQASQKAFSEIIGVSEAAVSKMMREGRIDPAGTLGEWIHLYCGQLRMQAAVRLGMNFEADPAYEDALIARVIRKRSKLLGVDDEH